MYTIHPPLPPQPSQKPQFNATLCDLANRRRPVLPLVERDNHKVAVELFSQPRLPPRRVYENARVRLSHTMRQLLKLSDEFVVGMASRSTFRLPPHLGLIPEDDIRFWIYGMSRRCAALGGDNASAN